MAALTVHFRDIKDLLSNLLTLWFFATPIIYPMTWVADRSEWGKSVMDFNPFAHLAISYQETRVRASPCGTRPKGQKNPTT